VRRVFAFVRRGDAFGIVLAACLFLPGIAAADMFKPRAVDFGAKYKAFTNVLGPTRRLVYCSYTGTLHQYESRNGKLIETRTRDLWSPVSSSWRSISMATVRTSSSATR
jgi:hypothetical protein